MIRARPGPRTRVALAVLAAVLAVVLLCCAGLATFSIITADGHRR